MEIVEARKRLDKIDAGMLELFQRRMEIVEQIAEYKMTYNRPLRDPAREAEIIAAVAEKTTPELAPYATRFVEKTIELSCDYQAELIKKAKK